MFTRTADTDRVNSLVIVVKSQRAIPVNGPSRHDKLDGHATDPGRLGSEGDRGHNKWDYRDSEIRGVVQCRR